MPGGHRRLLDQARVGALADQRVDRRVHDQNLHRAGAAPIAGAAALVAAAAACRTPCPGRASGRPSPASPPGTSAVSLQSTQVTRISRCAMTPTMPDASRYGSSPMSMRRGHGAGRILRVQRAEHENARQRRAQRELRRLGVADLADHDDVRVLPQQRPDRGREREPGLRPDLRLPDRRDLVLDRILDGQDVPLGAAEMRQRRIQRRRLARAGGTGHQDDAARLAEDVAEQRVDSAC